MCADLKSKTSFRGVLYKGSIDCFQQTVKKEGFYALYKGFLPCWLRMAPLVFYVTSFSCPMSTYFLYNHRWSLTFWLSFEQIRLFLGAGGYGS